MYQLSDRRAPTRFYSFHCQRCGLMQIMPDPGAQLADQLAWQKITIDLNRPYVSLVFGTHYLRQQLNSTRTSLQCWLLQRRAGKYDCLEGFHRIRRSDLFLEVIRIEETRNYIRLINEIYYIYRWLYGTLKSDEFSNIAVAQNIKSDRGNHHNCRKFLV